MTGGLSASPELYLTCNERIAPRAALYIREIRRLLPFDRDAGLHSRQPSEFYVEFVFYNVERYKIYV
jgi:hypothetical protein